MSQQKNQKSSPVIKLALLGIVSIGLVYLNKELDSLATKIESLPVQGKSQQAEPAADAGRPGGRHQLAKMMHPLMVESNQKAAILRKEGKANLDALFGRAQVQALLDKEKKEKTEQANRQAYETTKMERELKEAQAKMARGTAVGTGLPGMPPVLALPVPPSLQLGAVPPPSFAVTAPTVASPAPVPVQMDDAFTVLARTVQVQAVMNEGAVINGEFVALGATAKALKYWNENKSAILTPKLVSVKGNEILLQESEGSRLIKAILKP